eukprot:7285180-Prymnesium_polylepis.1
MAKHEQVVQRAAMQALHLAAWCPPMSNKPSRSSTSCICNRPKPNQTPKPKRKSKALGLT